MKSLILVILCISVPAISQISDKVSSVTTGQAREGQPLSIQAQLVQRSQITQVLLAYRQFGASEFKQVEMSITGSTASATIPSADVVPPEVEYYLMLRIQGKDTVETHPRESPETHPLRKQVQPRSANDAMVIFLSPEPGSRVLADELFISISLVRAAAGVNPAATKIYIDGRDVTTFAVVTEDIITLLPENISPPLSDGPHTIKVELYDRQGKLFHSVTSDFSQLGRQAVEAEGLAVRYNASLQLESRNETIQNSTTPYNRGNLMASSQYGILRFNGRVYVTNEDKSDRQPQNRFFIEAESPWVRVGYGDAFPVFPSLIMNGKRLRGLTSSATLGPFSLDFAMGEVIRKVEGDTLRTLTKSGYTGQLGTYAYFDTTDTNHYWAEYQYGTFTRDLLVVRPSFSIGENFRLGFSYLKSKDDVGSVKYGIKPEENVAVGSDLQLALDSRRFEFTLQGAASLTNRDIKSGTLSDADVDSLARSGILDDPQGVKDTRDRFSRFITVNQYLVPLTADKVTSVIAYEGALALNYFNNYFKGSYIFRGSAYNSFGQTFIRQDVKGFNLFDRLRLMENQVFLSAGFERLEDNTDGAKSATTTFLNWNSTVSYYPRTDFPNVTIGFGQNSSDNGVNTDSLFSASDMTNRFFLQLGYDFSAGLRHSASLGLGFSNRDDNTIRNLDTKNTTISAAVVTTWQLPLQTTVSITENLNQLPTPADTTNTRYTLSSLNYTTILLGGRYRLLEDRLQLVASLGPTFGDVNRTTWDASAEYLIVRNLSAALQFGLYQNPGVSTDVLWSLMLRYEI